MLLRCFYKILIVLTLLSTNSCITKYLWADKSYDEYINQFLLGEDGRYVVMIGKFHYVLIDETMVFSRILRLRQNGILTVDSRNTYLKLDSNNDLKGYITLHGPFGVLPIQDVGVLNSMGYYPDGNDEISIRLEISGRKYISKYIGQNIKNVATPLRLKINYDDSTLAQDVGKAAITPVTVGLDAVLLIGKIVVSPLSSQIEVF